MHNMRRAQKKNRCKIVKRNLVSDLRVPLQFILYFFTFDSGKDFFQNVLRVFSSCGTRFTTDPVNTEKLDSVTRV